MGSSYTIGDIDHLCADIGADGETLYLSLLDESNLPVILSIDEDLETDAVEEFAPGTGTSINLLCGDVTDIIWAVGDFASKFVVRYSNGRGWYWISDVESDSWSDGGPFLIGPMDDFDALVIEGPDRMHQSYFIGETGPYWTEVTDEMPIEALAIARLSLDFLQVLIGISNTDPAYFYTPVYFTPGGGTEWSDVSLSLTGQTTHITSIVFAG